VPVARHRRPQGQEAAQAAQAVEAAGLAQYETLEPHAPIRLGQGVHLGGQIGVPDLQVPPHVAVRGFQEGFRRVAVSQQQRPGKASGLQPFAHQHGLRVAHEGGVEVPARAMRGSRVEDGRVRGQGQPQDVREALGFETFGVVGVVGADERPG
jgi:hypothetical protein